MNSFMTLFRMSTGEDWYKIMYDSTRGPENGCQQASCSGNGFYIIYFIIFEILTANVMLQLFVLVLMEAIENNYIN